MVAKAFFKLFFALVVLCIIYVGAQYAIYYSFSGLTDAVDDYGQGIDAHTTPLYDGYQRVFQIIFGLLFIGIVIGMVACVVKSRYSEPPQIEQDYSRRRYYDEFER